MLQADIECGLIGRVVALKDDRAWLDIGDGVTIEFLRAAINRKLDDDPSSASFSADPDGKTPRHRKAPRPTRA